ncbi:MAG: dTDP-4-amino-4,6-dideoxygalactose transaminase [Bradymonadia bacterium]|jgi:dTDP-4-amino-4,6-dideoxygalactose transaminase
MIPFHTPYRTEREATYVAESLASGKHAGNGPFTQRAQRLLQELTGAPAALLTTSCTAAMELAGMACGIKAGDEIIVPSYTFCSTAAAYLRNGAKVVFADVDPSTMMLDPDDVATRITSQTRAICPMHYAGAPYEIDAIHGLADSHGLTVIEDAAQGVDATYNGRALGTFGAFGCFSFHETKNIHCGLGGALLINDESLIGRTEHIWERGTNRAEFLRGAVDKYTWVEVGSSFYPSEMQAAFLLAQLEAVKSNTEVRRTVWNTYRAHLAPGESRGDYSLQRIPEGARVNGHAFFLRLHDEDACEGLRRHLESAEIDARTHYVPLHTSPVGLELGNTLGTLEQTERWATSILRLPLHHDLSEVDTARVCACIKSYFQ